MVLPIAAALATASLAIHPDPMLLVPGLWDHSRSMALSMGSMVARYALEELGADRPVSRFVSISGPQHGTWTAYALDAPGIVEMRPGSHYLQDLDPGWPALASKVRVTCIWSPLDLMIVPSWSSELPDATAVQIPVALHPWMLTDPRVEQAVERALAVPQEARE